MSPLYIWESRCSWTPTTVLTAVGVCNFHVLSNLLLIYICKLHWNPQAMNGFYCTRRSSYESIRSIITASFISYIIAIPLISIMRNLIVNYVFKHTRKVNGSIKDASSADENVDVESLWHRKIHLKAIEELKILKLKMFKFRLSLKSSEDLQKFNCVWNLEPCDDVVFKKVGNNALRFIHHRRFIQLTWFPVKIYM